LARSIVGDVSVTLSPKMKKKNPIEKEYKEKMRAKKKPIIV
jgi:hypothetical protein